MKKPTCENLDGQCAKSWCNCAYLRRRSEVARNPAPTLCLPRASQGRANIGHQPRQRAGLAATFPIVHLVLASLVLMFAGCASRPAVAKRPPVNAAPTISAHEGKDRAIVDWAAKIDARLADLMAGRADLATVAADIKAATSGQRTEVAKAPAAQFNVIIDALQRNAGEDAKINAALRAEIEDLKNQALREQARWLTWSGVTLLAAFGVSIAFGSLASAAKTWPLALLGVGCFGLAQLISHPWFLRSFIGLLIAAAAYSAYYVFDRHRDGRLRRSLEKKADVLKQIVPVMDAAYENAEGSVKAALDANLFARLSSIFDKDQKALIHTVRAESKTKP